jgi:hypothetical protein
MLVLPDGGPAQVKIEERWHLLAVLELILAEYEVDHVSVMEVEEDDWHKPLSNYFNHGILPNDHVERRCLQQWLTAYILKVEVLYRWAFGQEFSCGVYQGKKPIKYYLRCIKVYVVDIKAIPKCIITSS